MTNSYEHLTKEIQELSTKETNEDVLVDKLDRIAGKLVEYVMEAMKIAGPGSELRGLLSELWEALIVNDERAVIALVKAIAKIIKRLINNKDKQCIIFWECLRCDERTNRELQLEFEAAIKAQLKIVDTIISTALVVMIADWYIAELQYTFDSSPRM